jgi:hypothetical protein
MVVYPNATISLDGTRGATSVDGLLNGSGTVNGLLDVLAPGTVAPGHSPGCITSSSLTLSGTYQAQLGGTTACTEYDQLLVTSGPVTLGGNLTLSLVNGYLPKGGESFKIIDNQGATPVNGTFSGLVEGATVTVSGVAFQISYRGGDGNDVVVTAVAKAPNTGSGSPLSPLMPLTMGMLGLLSLLVVTRRSQRFK